jgi:hypothetical protein
LYNAFPDRPQDVKDLIEDGQYDRALYVLEETCGRSNVRSKVPGFLEIPPDADLSTHAALLSLAKNKDGAFRLVTTNFDLAFDRGTEKPSIDCAPKLPIPKKERWNSLVYLHGRLDPSDPECTNLVLSSADFGLAYLTEQWASRFVTELFRRFMVLFIGYSVDDPVMRYMMDAFAADRAIGETVSRAFALTGAKRENFDITRREWRNKSIEPILYEIENGSHQALHATLKHWADRHRHGLQGKDAIILENHQRPKVPSAARLVCWALRDDTGHPARVFATLEPPPPFEWLEILEKDGLLAIQRPLASESTDRLSVASTGPLNLDLHPVTIHLIDWVSKYINDERLVRWVVDRGAYLHPRTRLAVRDHLRQVHGPAGMEKFWRIVTSAEFSRSFVSNLLDYHLFESLNRGQWSPDIRAEVLDWLTPVLRIAPAWPSFGEEIRSQDRLSTFVRGEVKLRGQDEFDLLHEAIQSSPVREKILAELADDLTSQLKKACDLLALVEQAGEEFDSSYITRPSIDDHPQNTRLHSWTDLIPLLRGSFLVTARSVPAVARSLVHRWRTLPFPIFRRFVFYAAAKTDLISTSEALDRLLEPDGRWLWWPFAQREAFQMLETIWPELADPDSARLIRAILNGPKRELFHSDTSDESFGRITRRSVAARLEALARTARPLPSDAVAALEKVRIPEASTGQAADRAHFPSWMQASTGDPTLGMVDPQADLRLMGDQEARAIISTLSSDSPYWASWRALIHEDLNRAISLLVGGDEASWPVVAWQELLKSLPHPFPGKDVWQRICPALIQAKSLTELAEEISFVVREASKVAGEADEVCLFDVWDRIVQPILGRETEASDDVLSQALNAPAGALAECIVNRLGVRNPSRSSDIPASVWTRLETLARARGGGPTVAQTILASQMSRFFSLDRTWVKENLIPLLDWKLNPNAAALWKGFFWQFSVPADLWPLIKTNFILSLKNSSELGDVVEIAASWFTAICIEQPTWIETEPATEVLKSLPPNGRAAAARVLFQKMEGAELAQIRCGGSASARGSKIPGQGISH